MISGTTYAKCEATSHLAPTVDRMFYGTVSLPTWRVMVHHSRKSATCFVTVHEPPR
jgi:hypothetical protein